MLGQGYVWVLLIRPSKSSEDSFCNQVASEFHGVNLEAEPNILPPFPPALERLKAKVIQWLVALLTNPNSKEQIPRNDYREAFELALVMLGVVPPRWREVARWRKCGNTSHAR